MKRNKSLLVLSLAILSSFTTSLFAQEAAKEKEEAFSFEASYVGDLINNLSGGIKTGSSYLGMAILS